MHEVAMASGRRVRVLIADSDAHAWRQFRNLLEAEPDFDVSATLVAVTVTVCRVLIAAGAA